MTYNGEVDQPEWMSQLSPQDKDQWDHLHPCPSSDEEDLEGLETARTSTSGGPSLEEMEARLGFLSAEEVEALGRMGPCEVRRFLDAHEAGPTDHPEPLIEANPAAYGERRM